MGQNTRAILKVVCALGSSLDLKKLFKTELLWILFTFVELYQMCLQVYLALINQRSCPLLCRRDYGHVLQIMAVNCCDTLCHHTSWRTQGYCICLELDVDGEMC